MKLDLSKNFVLVYCYYCIYELMWLCLADECGKDFSFLKDKLSEALVEKICPIGKKMDKLMQDKSHLENIIKKGTEKANIKAEENIKKIREIIGFV